MNLKQIRNATLLIQYANTKFLIDPVFAPKGAYPSFPNSIRQDVGNPMVPLPVSIEELLQVDAVIVTHLHSDHFDEYAMRLLPKDIKLFVQNEADANHMQEASFTNVEVLTADSHFHEIRLIKTPGHHGHGEILKRMGETCGIIFSHPTEKSLYLAGDTIWYEGVEKAIQTYHPEVIITNNGANQLLGFDPIVMGKEDLYQVHQAAPDATLIASHMEAMNHWTLSRKELSDYVKSKGFSSQVLIPDDGESYCL